MPTFGVTTIRSAELTSDHRRIWSALQASNPLLASPYFSCEFARLVAEVRGDVTIGILHRGGRIEGFFPFQSPRAGRGEPLAHAASDFHGVVAAPGTRFEPQRLLRGCGLREWSFHHLLGDQGPFLPYHKETHPSPYLDLSCGYEAFARRRLAAGTRQIRQVEASRRRLEDKVGAVHFVARSADASVLERLMAWKVDKFRPYGFTGFAPWLVSLLRALCRTEVEDFSGMLSALYADDELIAAHIGMRSPRAWHYWFPAYDARFARYQPGLILLLEMARHAEAIGLARIDLGSGDELYKKRLADAWVLVARGRVLATGR